MKQTFTILLIVLNLITITFAEQAASWSCKGEESFVLEGQITYHGDGSSYSQTLYILKKEKEPWNAAFFLTSTNTSKENGKVNVINARNAKGGSFTLTIVNIKDIGDGTVIEEQGDGIITYKHGALSGTKQKVTCKRE